MKTKTLFLAAAMAVCAMGAPVQASSFFGGLLVGVNWQPPKCDAPDVLREVKDKNGKLVWRCVKPVAQEIALNR
jgi:hypothetical protein